MARRGEGLGGMNAPHDFDALRRVSARFGADPMLVQGPGGNTSVKDGDVMWIKASGTELADAARRDIFVRVDWKGIAGAVARDLSEADQPQRFALAHDGLRPSIETCLHALFPHRAVLHVHCVNTIAFALRMDAREALSERLRGFSWAFVDYAKPGARLAAKVRAARRPGDDVVVLGNHGLIVAGETVSAAADLIRGVADALRAEPGPSALSARLDPIANYSPAPEGHSLHEVARSPRLLTLATGGSLYPDHVVFCGPGAMAFSDVDEAARGLGRFAAQGLKPPPFFLIAGAGAWIADDSSSGARAMARCLGDVVIRTPENVRPRYLTDAEVRELIDWDAEKYRQALNGR